MNYENKKKPIGHKLYLPQEVVWREVWTKGFQKKHNYR